MDKRTKNIIKKKNLTSFLKPAKEDTDIIDFVFIENPKSLDLSFMCKAEEFF